MIGAAPIFGPLSDGSLSASPRRTPGPQTAQPARGISFTKNLLAILLAALVLCIAIPAGGTPPLVGLFAAIAVGTLCLFAAIAFPAARKPTTAGTDAILLTGLAFCGFALLQAGLACLPLAERPLALADRSLMLRRGSLSPSATLLATVRAAATLGFLWLVLCISRNPERARWTGTALFAGVVAQSVWALMFLASDHATAYPGSAVGTFVGRNALATHLGMGLVLGLALLRPGRPSVILWLGLASIGVALLATQSRMGLAATLCGGLLVLALRRPGRSRAAILGVTAFVLAATLGQGVAERAVWASAEFETRRQLYAQVWQMIAARPLTGFGADSFPLAYEIFHRPPVPADLVWDRAHSTYLALWAESGLVFGSLPPLAGALALALLWPRRQAPLAAAAIAALCLAGLHSLVDFSLEIPANLYLLLAVTGLGLGAARPAKG